MNSFFLEFSFFDNYSSFLWLYSNPTKTFCYVFEIFETEIKDNDFSLFLQYMQGLQMKCTMYNSLFIRFFSHRVTFLRFISNKAHKS